MTSRLGWRFFQCALVIALGVVWLGCATSSGEPANKAALTVPAGHLATRFHVDMCGVLVGKTIMTEATYDAAFKEAIAEGKAAEDSLKHADRINATVTAPAHLQAPRKGNPPLALVNAMPPQYVIEHNLKSRGDSLTKIDTRFGRFLQNAGEKFYTTSTHVGCGGVAMPEVQDVQRLINADHSFGPQVQLTALPGGAALNQLADFDTGYVLVAAANVTLDQEPKRSWYPMTTGYTRLNLAAGPNCVFLRHSNTPHRAAPTRRPGDSLHVVTNAPQAPSAGDRAAMPVNPALSRFLAGSWTAAVVPASGNDCDASRAASAPQLDVEAFADDPVDSIPPAARFIEGKDEMSLIAVKCARAWCVLGPDPRGSLQVAVHDTAHGKPGAPQFGRRTANPLWFDEQHLAVDDPANPKRLIPQFRASIVPDTGLQNPARNYKEKWYPMAHVYAPTDPPKHYAEGFGFRKGWNQVRLRQLDGIWFAMIIAADHTVHVREVAPMEHTFGEVPGTVRFDWVDSDDLVWIPCSDGCCLVQDGRDY